MLDVVRIVKNAFCKFCSFFTVAGFITLVLLVFLSNLLLVDPAFSGTTGTIKATYNTGKIESGRGTLNDPKGPITYIDYSGKPYPSKLELTTKKSPYVTQLSFTSDGAQPTTRTYTSWVYFYNSEWVAPRLTNLK